MVRVRYFGAFIVIVLSCLVFCEEQVVVRSGDNKKLNASNNCGSLFGKKFIATDFLLMSPNYPKTYPPNLNCEIFLQGGNCTASYKFDFLDFNLENSTGCAKDRVEIERVDAICGHRNGSKIFHAKNGTLKVRFITDDSGFDHGFKILIEKIEGCVKKSQYFPNKNSNSDSKTCCSNLSGASKHFFMKSPSFPVSLSSPNDCVYRFRKFSAEICRIRIKFHFFWFGNSMSCAEGSLEIDGKAICGCKKELTVVSAFPEDFKILTFRSSGIVRNSYSGFFAEVFQDDCPKKIEKNAEYAQLPIQSIIREVYFITYPEDTYSSRREKEEVDYLDTKDINVNWNKMDDYNSCLNWNQIQFQKLEYNGQVQSKDLCISQNSMQAEKNCLEFHQSSGIFFSPGYPFFYPGNTKLCYRFFRLPGQCGLRMKFLDFRIPYSSSCVQDSLRFTSIEGAFCGQNLWNKVVVLDFKDRNFEDLILQTKTARCLQGFRTIFEQIPCQETTTPRNIWPPTTTSRTPTNCGGVYNGENSVITNEFDSSECYFIIEKYSSEVCRLEIFFEQLNMNCPSEVLLIMGEEYCGDFTNRKEILDFGDKPIEIVYRRMNSYTRSAGFYMRIIQDSRNCISPPAQITNS